MSQPTRLEQNFAAAPPGVSFEFFPPKNEQMETRLWETIKRLEPLGPRFVSVTYGAGGSTRERTHQTVVRIRKETNLIPAAHLTCVGASKAEINDVAQNYWDAGIRHIVALRGDAPKDQPNWTPHPEGYHHSFELVEGLKTIGDFEISVAAFPEKHPEAVSIEKDIEYLKRKIDAGANRAITQYFFDIEHFLRFRDLTAKAGITAPIVPGIMPINNFTQAVRFSAMCGTSVPNWLHKLFEGQSEENETTSMTGAALAVEQCQLLRNEGVEEFHFYTLNRAELTTAVCHMLGIRANK